MVLGWVFFKSANLFTDWVIRCFACCLSCWVVFNLPAGNCILNCRESQTIMLFAPLDYTLCCSHILGGHVLDYGLLLWTPTASEANGVQLDPRWLADRCTPVGVHALWITIVFVEIFSLYPNSVANITPQKRFTGFLGVSVCLTMPKSSQTKSEFWNIIYIVSFIEYLGMRGWWQLVKCNRSCGLLKFIV